MTPEEKAKNEASEAKNEAEVEWVDEDGSTTIPRPKCGGLFKSDKGEIVPYVGTNPDAKVNSYSYCEAQTKWTIEARQNIEGWSKIKGPVNVGQYRPRGVKSEMKTQETCTRYDGTKLDGLSGTNEQPMMSISTYKGLVRMHCIKNGMWDAFHIPDPRNKALKWDVFRHQSKFPLAYVSKYINDFKNSPECDNYARQNLEFSGEYIRNTLSADFLSKVLKDVDLDASGPETFVGALLVIQSDSYEALETCKETLKKLSLMDYPGENVADCCTDIKKYAERLDSAGAFEPELLCSIAKIFESTSEKRFELWAMQRYDECAKYVRKTKVTDANELVREGSVITYNELTRDTSQQYRDLVEAGRYGPALKNTGPKEPTLPAAYKAAITQSVTEALKQSPFHQRGGGGGGGGKQGSGEFNGLCYGCGEKGHRRSKCPNNTGDGSGNKDKTKAGGEDSDWRSTPPTSDPESATLQKFGNTYKWCSKCNLWLYHHAPGHDAWAERRAKRQKEGAAGPPAARLAEVTAEVKLAEAVAEDADEDFIFGGLAAVRL